MSKNQAISGHQSGAWWPRMLCRPTLPRLTCRPGEPANAGGTASVIRVRLSPWWEGRPQSPRNHGAVLTQEDLEAEGAVLPDPLLLRGRETCKWTPRFANGSPWMQPKTQEVLGLVKCSVSAVSPAGDEAVSLSPISLPWAPTHEWWETQALSARFTRVACCCLNLAGCIQFCAPRREYAGARFV